MNFKKVIALLLCMVLMFSIIPINQANAWKVKTHNYSANLILEEITTIGGGNKVYIPPFGQFEIAPEFATALRKYPNAYRAGSLGPDAYPDIYVGQGYIHPEDNRTSGEWIKLMIQDALSLPENSDKRYEVIAFLLGYMTHYSGDLFGHTYINQIANGAYPALTDLADPTKAEAALSIILKHITSEGVIDSKIPAQYGQGQYIKIDAPNDFVLNSFVYNGTKDNGLSSKYYGMEAPEHFKYLVELRTYVKNKADYYRAYGNSSNIFDYAENTVICNYLDAWLDDIDRAINEWINVSERIANGLISNGSESDLDVAINEIKNWFHSYGKYLSAAPDVLIDALGLPGDVAKFFSEKLGITVLQDLYEEFTQYIDDLIKDFMIYNVAGLTEEQVQQIKEAFSKPTLILGEEVLIKMDEDMKNFSTGQLALQQEFAPFYNTLTMVKLILIGPDGYKKLIERSKNLENTGYNYQTAYEKVDNLKVSIKTKGGISKYKGFLGIWYPYADQNGTDDDIFFGVKFKNGSTVETLFDRSGYNDFEAGDYDTYSIALGKKVKLEDISEFYLKKKSTHLPGPDWKPEYFEVRAYDGNTKIKDVGRTNIDYYIKGSTTKYFGVNAYSNSYKTALNSGIIDFISSLDESMQWQHEDFKLWSDPQLREDIFYKIFKDVRKYDDPNFDPYVYVEGEKSNGQEPEEPKTEEPKPEEPKQDLTALANSIDYSNASNWAIGEMKNAVINNLVRDISIFKDCKANITRRDFADISVNLYEALIGKEVEAAPNDTFTDTSDIKVLKAYKNKIVGGKGNGIFAPNDSLTREEMAVMFKRVIDGAYRYKNKELTLPSGSLSIGDKDKVSSWAKEHVHFVFSNKIITGNGVNFNPRGTAPVEQAIAIVNRVYEKYKNEFIVTTKDINYDFSSKPSMTAIDGSFSRNLAYDGSIYGTPNGDNDALGIFNDSSFVNGTIETNITVYDPMDGGVNDSGISFRVSNAGSGRDNYNGYYVGIRQNLNGNTGEVLFGYHDIGTWNQIGTYKTDIFRRTAYNLKVVAEGSHFDIYLDGKKVISVDDSKYKEGKIGFRVLKIPTIFQNIKVTK